MTYNVWKNRETWNVALWINNDENFYNLGRAFMRNYKGRSPYKDFTTMYSSDMFLGLETPDRVMWSDSQLDYKALNEMMKELL